MGNYNTLEHSWYQLFLSQWMDVPHVWGLNLETKAPLKKLRTCGSRQQPTLSNGMSYSCA